MSGGIKVVCVGSCRSSAHIGHSRLRWISGAVRLPGPLGRGRCGMARAVTVGERIVLPDQPGQFGERIAAGTGSRRPHRRTTRGRFIRTIRSLGMVVRHSFPGYELARPSAAAASCARPANQNYRISSGASTPSSASPEARTVTIPCTKSEPRHSRFWIILDNEA